MIVYNEIDPFAAAWLRNLSSAGHIAAGKVEERSIKELLPEDVRGATQAHFFAGIGVWSYALKLAGIADTTRLWTGSCPCQPFSAAGKRKGLADDRHLWPEWFRLIRECRPPIILGEQVASAGDWLDVVSGDLEGEDYAFGAIVLGAHSVGAPNIRQRFYFVAYAADARPAGREVSRDDRGDAGGRQGRGVQPERGDEARLVANADTTGLGIERSSRLQRPGLHDVDGRRQDGELGDTAGAGLEGCANEDSGGAGWGKEGRAAIASGGASFWANAEWIHCRDGKLRPIESGTFPLAYGAASRVGRLRAYGNALNARTAAIFCRAALSQVSG